MEAKIPDDRLLRFSGFVAEAIGLDFPPERWPDLKRGIVATAIALGFDDAAECARLLMSMPLSKNQLDVLAGHLTVGETYFFRDKKAFEVLVEKVLPPLILARQDRRRRLRIWSAGCCTGEEPYSIAIALRRAIPDWEKWNITLLATDINPVFLRKAEAGVFGQWSFRDAPSWLKTQYFRVTADGQFQIRPEIKQMVRFLQLNLADDVYPSVENNTNAMDVICCRNVLMYFTASQAEKVVRKLYRAQVDRGWLIVSPSELPHISSTRYVPVNLRGATLYRKYASEPQRTRSKSWAMELQPLVTEDPKDDETIALSAGPEQLLTLASHQTPGADEVTSDPQSEAMVLYKQGDYAGVVNRLKDSRNGRPTEPSSFGLLARSLANRGQLHEALNCCDQWILAEKLNLGSHYLRALILQEQGAFEEAVHSLRNALYLDPKFVLAHFALGNIARNRGHVSEARKHLAIASQLLGGYRPDDILPESEGVTADRFAEIVRSLTNEEAIA